MNSNPQAKVVLCYGDSNVWGQNDDKNYAGRYASNVRWTGKLQELLGNDYYIIEEGLGGRTTDLEHHNPAKQSRNGLTYFKPCLISHSPLDVVIIMLGTNDLKLQYQRPAHKIADALKPFIDEVADIAPMAKVLLVSPIFIDDTAPKFTEYYDGTYDKVSAEKSRQLGVEVKRVADETGSLFFDASTVAKAGKDGIHFDEPSHPALAQSLAVVIARALARESAGS
jgi:lysophospholipase L1-like esterase